MQGQDILSTLHSIFMEYIHNLSKYPLVFVLTFVLPVLLSLASPPLDDAPVQVPVHPQPHAQLQLQPQPPKASPSVPLLGNALHYKDNPDQFLADQAGKLGGIFSINLAGLKTTILSSRQAVKQLSLMSERVLSSNAAVADFGFRYTLGDRNVFSGTDVHKRIIKQKYSKKNDMECSAQLYWKFLTEAMSSEINGVVGEEVFVPDFMVTCRRIILQTMTYEMIGKKVVEMYGAVNNNANFVSDFMVFQDLVEDCTAKAAVCPTWLATFLFLNDCQNKRLKLVSKIENAISSALDSSEGDEDDSMGRWLLSVHALTKDDNISKLYTLNDIADFTVGLMFAAHKNASIAAAQALLYSLEFDRLRADGSDLDGALLMCDMCTEARAMLKAVSLPGSSIMDSLGTCEVIEKVVLETLRVTAHSIGAVRKVVVKEGWQVTVPDDDNDPASPVKQYLLPYGSYVGVSHIIHHRDAQRWGADCTSFNPKRDNLMALSKSDLDFATFSIGVHKCPGNKVALQVIRLFVVALLSHYEIEIPARGSATLTGLPPTSFERATLAQRSDACRLSFKRIKN